MIGDTKHYISKGIRTLRQCASLWVVWNFGKYIHSGWNGKYEYVRYEYKGKVWIIPTSGMEDES